MERIFFDIFTKIPSSHLPRSLSILGMQVPNAFQSLFIFLILSKKNRERERELRGSQREVIETLALEIFCYSFLMIELIYGFSLISKNFTFSGHIYVLVVDFYYLIVMIESCCWFYVQQKFFASEFFFFNCRDQNSVAQIKILSRCHDSGFFILF